MWQGADGNLNRALNHLIDTPEDKIQRGRTSVNNAGPARVSPRGEKTKKPKKEKTLKKEKSAPRISDFPMPDNFGAFGSMSPSGGAQQPAGMMGLAPGGMFGTVHFCVHLFSVASFIIRFYLSLFLRPPTVIIKKRLTFGSRR